jgi:glycosyltransferase involved in cell wall biosynthesis
MIFIGIPVFNEAPTIGVLLWQIRKTFQDFQRDYQILVYNDASTDATADILAPYTAVLPLTVIRGEQRLGYGGALEAICRAASERGRYARRDALITMQGDFTDNPSDLPELVKRFEGGADLVVVERPMSDRATMPVPVRRFRQAARWVLRPFVRLPGITDPFESFRLYRLSVLRDVLKRLDDGTPLITHGGRAANVELLVRTAPVARRVETIELPSRYDLRPRTTRVRPMADTLTLYRFGRAARALRSS